MVIIGLIALVALATAAAVWLAARNAFAGARDTVEIMHLLGASQRQITAVFLRDVLREVLEDQDAPAEPVLHATGGQCARLLDRGIQVLLDGLALQVIVVQGEQGKCQDHYA